MKLLYFASIREKIGISEEEHDLPKGVSNVTDLIDWLKSQGEEYAQALADQMVVKVAVNQEYVSVEHPISSNDEIAFFPPVTGG